MIPGGFAGKTGACIARFQWHVSKALLVKMHIWNSSHV